MFVRRADAADLDRCAEVLGDAFSDYPWTRWTVDADDHRRRIVALQRLAVEHYGLAHGEVWVADVEGTIEAVAVCMDSDHAVPPTTNAMIDPLAAELEGRRHAASVAAGAATQILKPSGHHLYLATIGTSSHMQRRGIGRAVLAPVVAQAGERGVPAFLETSSATNVSFYTGLGFHVTGHVVIPGGGPDVWGMLRIPARSTTSSARVQRDVLGSVAEVAESSHLALGVELPQV